MYIIYDKNILITIRKSFVKKEDFATKGRVSLVLAAFNKISNITRVSINKMLVIFQNFLMISISVLSEKVLKDVFSHRVSIGNITLCHGQQIPTGWADLS